MNELDKLRQTLSGNDKTPSRGTVQSIQNGQLTIKSNRGAILTVAAGTGAYQSGDRVVMNNGIVVEKITTGAGKPVYVV